MLGVPLKLGSLEVSEEAPVADGVLSRDFRSVFIPELLAFDTDLDRSDELRAGDSPT